MLTNLLLIGIAGGLGAIARYGTGILVEHFLPPKEFPWATFVVNMIGCLFFGIIYAIIEASQWDPDTQARVRTITLVGFMGAFTTYSTFAFQSAVLLEQSKWGLALLNIAGQTSLGLVVIFAGLWLGKTLT